ncbi:MAG: hypothetical protein IKM87_08745 [Clostridia bacterium]|nr:hypothetical protein [Clostridia bacterium]
MTEGYRTPGVTEVYVKTKRDLKDSLMRYASEEMGRLRDAKGEYLEYLDISSRFANFSVNNLLLIKKQMPEATDLRTFAGWYREGIRLRDGAFPVSLIQKEKTKDKDGKEHFSSERFYDARDTVFGARVPLKRDPEELISGAERLAGKDAGDRLPFGDEIIRDELMELLREGIDPLIVREGVTDEKRKQLIRDSVIYAVMRRYRIDVSPDETDTSALKDMSDQSDLKAVLNSVRNVFRRTAYVIDDELMKKDMAERLMHDGEREDPLMTI